MKTLHALFLIPCLAGCGAMRAAQSVVTDPFGGSASTSTATTQETAPVATSGWEHGATAPGATLYGRDGSPVGTVTSNGVPSRPTVSQDPLPHGLEEPRGSRLVLLDLYQQAVDERDELLLEVQGQHEMLSAAESRIAALEAQVARMQGDLDKVTLERNSLEGQTHELAERLVTAQMRRLESEKRYLETAIRSRSGATPPNMSTPSSQPLDMPSTGDQR